MHPANRSADTVRSADDVVTRGAANTSKGKGPTPAAAVASARSPNKSAGSPIRSPAYKTTEKSGSLMNHRARADEGHPTHASHEGWKNNTNGDSATTTTRSGVVGSREGEGISGTSPYLVWRRRKNMLSSSANSWQTAEKERAIGVGTVGLFQNQQPENTPPEGASACINGSIVVGPPGYVRKVRDYMDWRERHSDLFSSLRNQDERERQHTRLRRIRERAKQQEEEECQYAAAVRRLRQRGWSVVGTAPRQVDHTRLNQIKAEREAFRAECEENVMRKIHEASKQRKNISEQIAMYKDEKARHENIVRDAARLDREMQNAKREEYSAFLKERAANTRAIVEAERELFRECAAVENKYRQDRIDILRERVFAKTHTSGFLSNSPGKMGGTGRPYPLGDWRSTFRSPLQKLPNASDEAFRRQWVSELQEERRALARAEVERTKRLQTSAQREAAYRDNCERAEALRNEKEALRERKQQQCEEVQRFHRALRQQELEGQKRREEAVHALRESKREKALLLRQTIEEEEMLAQTAEEEELRRLREHVARMKNSASPSRRAPSPLAEEFEE